MTRYGRRPAASVVDVQDLPAVRHGAAGTLMAQLTVARMTAERLSDACVPVKALVLPPDVFPEADTAFGYHILRADVLEPGVLA